MHPLLTLFVGLALFLLLPSLPLPFVLGPVTTALRALGLLGASAGGWEQGFATAMVLRWLSVPLMLAWVAWVERQPLASIGLRVPTWREVGLALAAGVVAVVVGEGLYLLVHGPGVDANTQIGLIFGTLGIAGRAQVALNAAMVEELFFRGVLIERLLWLRAPAWLAAAASLVLFVGSHYWTGSSSLLLTVTGDLVGGIVLVGLYMLRRNLAANTIAHAVLNVYVVIG